LVVAVVEHITQVHPQLEPIQAVLAVREIYLLVAQEALAHKIQLEQEAVAEVIAE
jgi:hypothetical protein